MATETVNVVIGNDIITNANLANVPTNTLKGRDTAGSGDPEDLTATEATVLLKTATDPFVRVSELPSDTGITQLTGDVTAGPGSGSQVATIPNDTVTNAKAANMAQRTFKGRFTAGTGDPQDGSADDASNVLDTASDPFPRTSSLGTAAFANTGDFDVAGAAAAAQSAAISAAATDATTKANAAQAFAIQRANHTGTQLAATVSDFNSAALAAAPAETTTTTGALINGATSKATPVDADMVGLMDSAAANILKKLSWLNIKATLKTYFDTLYPSGSGTSTGTNTGDQTSVSGNAGTATALQTGRTIDGTTFDGTANITVIAPGTHAATGKTTPVDADELPLVDSAASNVLKRLTWANLKATLKTYLDTLYQPTDAELTAISGLTSAANKAIQFTGSGTAALVDLNNPGSATYAGTPAWTAGLAPSGETKTINWVQIGNMVQYQFTLTYSSAGTTVTNLTLPFPAGMPAPFEQNSLTAASSNLYPNFVKCVNGATGTTYVNANGFLRRNAADTAYEFNHVISTGTYSHFYVHGTYFTA